MGSKPHAQAALQAPHLVRAIRQAELRAAHEGVHAGVGDAVQTLVASMRQSMLNRLPQRNVRPTAAFKPNCAGPVTELRAGVALLTRGRHRVGSRVQIAPSATSSTAAPVSRGRSVLVNPVPGTGTRNTGVSGRPLPVVSCATNVQSFSSRPRKPSTSDPPAMPAPVVYCACAVDLVPLVERRAPVLGVQVQPVLRQAESRQRRARERGGVVGGLGERVLHAGGEAVAQPAPHLQLAGVAERAAGGRQVGEAGRARRAHAGRCRPGRCWAGTAASGCARASPGRWRSRSATPAGPAAPTPASSRRSRRGSWDRRRRCRSAPWRRWRSRWPASAAPAAWTATLAVVDSGACCASSSASDW